MKFGISLDPKKSLFAMEEGIFLGHIISKYDIRIDHSRIEVIQSLDYPRSKKEIYSFNGKINFLRRFFPNITKDLRKVNDMLKKDSEVKWYEEENNSLNQVKFSLSHDPILISPDYTLYFIIFSLASEHTLVFFLMQKKNKKTEQSIAFLDRTIIDNLEVQYH